MRLPAFILLIVLASIKVYGQDNTVNKIEIPLQYKENPFTVIPVAENGFVLIREQYKNDQANVRFWEVLLYDTDMQLSWQTVVEAEYMFGLFGHTFSANKLFLMFAGIKNLSEQLYVHQIDLVEKSYEKIPIDTYLPDRITYFSSFNNTLILGGKEQGKNSFIFFDPEERHATILQGIFRNRSEIFDISQDTTNQLFTMIITYLNNRKEVALNLRSYDLYGQPLENIRIDPDDNMVFVNAKTCIINNDLRLIAGIYNNKKSASPSGLFLCSVQLDGKQNMMYYPIEKTFQLLDTMNGPDLSYSLEEVSHFLKDDNWNVSHVYDLGMENAVIMEGFNNQQYYASTGELKKIFVHDLGMIIGFDDQLGISWINDFSLKNTVSNTFSYYVNLLPDQDHIKLYSFYLNRITEKIIDGSNTVKPLTSVPLVKAEYKNDAPINYSNDLSHFQAWYSNFYLFSGVKSFENGEDDPIFFIHKVAYGSRK